MFASERHQIFAPPQPKTNFKKWQHLAGMGGSIWSEWVAGIAPDYLIARYNIDEPRYIRITDIDENGNLIDDIGVTAENVEDKYILNNNDIIIARSGNTVGKTYLHKSNNVNYPCFFAGYMIRFVVDENKINPDYVFVITQLGFYNRWIKAIQRITGQPNINADEYKSFKIPFPSNDIQIQIIEKFTKAKIKIDSKANDSKLLLKEVDKYILSELGIILFFENNNISNRIFLKDFKIVNTIGRLDPKRYSSFVSNLEDSIKNDMHPKQKLSDLIIHSASGDWGVDEEIISDFDIYQECLVIRSTEFDNDFNLNIDNNRLKYRHILKSKLKKLDIQPNDILIEKSGGSENQPVGRVAIIENHLTENYTLCYSNFIHKIRVNEQLVLPNYLFYYLKLMHNIKYTDVMQSQTNGIRNLIMKEFFAQEIPLPTIKKQEEIIEKISSLFVNAKENLSQSEILNSNLLIEIESVLKS